MHPGSSPERIGVSFAGATSATLASNGDLVLATALGEVRQRKPHVYQVVDGRKIDVEASHRIDGDTVAFAVGTYDRSRDLVVDPVIEWSTYLGGATSGYPYNEADDEIRTMSVGADKSVYVAGQTPSSDFPILNAVDAEPTNWEGFVSKFTPDPATGAPTLAWSTYLGGIANDNVASIVTRPDGAVYLAGSTYSSDFPILHEFQTFHVGPVLFEAFATKLQETANQVSLVWSTYLGGNGDDRGAAIDVDGAGNVYVGGMTQSVDFPTVNAFLGDQPGQDLFVTKFNPLTGANLTVAYSTYLGGSGTSELLSRMQVDSSGAVYLVGSTNSTNFPTLNPIQPRQPGKEGFLTKFRARHAPNVTLEWSSYLGGSGEDTIGGLFVTGTAVYVAGGTGSSNFPVVNGYQGDQDGSTDAFFAKVNQSVPLTLAWSSYYAGSSVDGATAIAVDRAGAVYVGGTTSSADLPMFDPAQPYQGSGDAYVARFVIGPAGGPDLAGSTMLGGTGAETTVQMALDGEAGIYLAGTTSSSDFPLLNPYSLYRGALDGFITKIHNDPVAVTIASSPQGLGFTSSGAAGCAPGSYVTPQPLGLIPIPSTACQFTFSSTYALGTGSRLTFRRWSDQYLPAVPQLTLDVDGFPSYSMTFTALYATQHQLLTAALPVGSGVVTPASGAFFDAGTTVAVAATANACFRFDRWSTNAPNGVVTMSSPQKVTATFAADGATALANVSIGSGQMVSLGGGRYRQVVTVRNNGPAVTSPRLVIANLTPFFTVLNANGSTTCSVPSGRPFVNIPLPFGIQSITLEFFRPGAATPPTYTPTVVANGQP